MFLLRYQLGQVIHVRAYKFMFMLRVDKDPSIMSGPLLCISLGSVRASLTMILDEFEHKSESFICFK